ncbi:hypothetical protein C3942_00695 [Solimonas fluminis]|uniref:ParB-like N-terminal domain-containing protein n=1 Tax=Solimonas fluminis TaxID=2086571 RepID=A0A2S5TKB7_9GAMM|nr:ParB/RepB/Spo0J family partition protein [Solimonas fluminis]PPE75446.1 hypothetical protein C3942_00695 [Solimonas fluminis]
MNMPAKIETLDYQLVKAQINQLRPYAKQLRKLFNPEALQELADSIRAQGVVQPIVIRTAKPGADGTKTIEPWEIIAGERRWRAAQLAGLDGIPAIVRDDLSDTDVEILHLVENLQRASLTLIETCDGAAKLVALVGFDEACKQAGQTPAWMSRHSRLGELDERIQALVEEGKVTSMEMAHDLQQLKGYDAVQFGKTLGDFEGGYAWSRPPTRQQLRDRVKDAKEAFELRQERIEAKRKEREELKKKIAADPTLKAKLAADKAKDPETRRKEREVKVKALNAEGERIGEELTMKFLQLAGFDLSKPKKGRRVDLPVKVDLASRYTTYGGEVLPENAESSKYSVNFCGGIDTIAPALNIVAPGSKVDLEHDELYQITQEEARKIEKAIGRPLIWRHYGDDLTAKKIRALIDGVGDKKVAKPAAKAGQNSSVFDFLAASCVKKKGSNIQAAEMHEEYSTWCKEQGRAAEILPLKGGTNEFGNAIAKAKIKRHRTKAGFVYLDIEFKA